MLVIGILYLNQFRDGLIEARVESLMTQGEIIAGAIAASATVETDSITHRSGKAARAAGRRKPRRPAPTSSTASISRSIRSAWRRCCRRLISPTRTRARIYDRDANLLLDSRHLYSRGQILRYDLPPVDEEEPDVFDRVQKFVADFFRRTDLPVYQEQPGGNGAAFPEVMNALTGVPVDRGAHQRAGRADRFGRGADPALPRRARRADAVDRRAATSTRSSPPSARRSCASSASRRWSTCILSMLLASTIANPLRRLAAAAVRVRRGVKSREEIPDFSDRQDEIGNLSVAVRDMTNALYARIEAIESFAADVIARAEEPADLAAQRRRDAAARQERDVARAG